MKTTLENINSNVNYAIQATEATYRNKSFVVVNGEHVQSFNKTKRGAESYVKKNTFSYYDEYSQEMVQAGSELQIVEISAFDIVDYYNTKEIWFETIFSKWRIGQSNDYTLTQANELGCSEEVISFIELVLSHTDANSFPSREMVGLEEIQENEVAEIVETTSEVIETIATATTQNETVEVVSEITYKLNDEKNGVEIYFTDKPSEQVRDSLKVNGFRWSKYNKCWYAKQSNETLSLAETLAGGNVSKVEEVQPFEIELSEFIEVTNYKISEETEKRLIDNSLFGDRRKENYETRQLQLTLSNLLEETKVVVELADNNYYKNKLIDGFNAFCERYAREMNTYLYQRSVNPSWAVTGRGGLNVDRYNKKQDAIFNKMGKVVEMLDKQQSILKKYKNRFESEKVYKTKQAIQHAIDNLDSVTLSFETRKREIEYYGYRYNTRSYESPNYFMMNLANCYRIFDRTTGKEVHSMKTTDKLTDAKKHVLYLEHIRASETA